MMKKLLGLAVICIIAVSGLLCACNDEDRMIFCYLGMPGHEGENYTMPTNGGEIFLKLYFHKEDKWAEENISIESLELAADTFKSGPIPDERFIHGDTVRENGVEAWITDNRKGVHVKFEPNTYPIKKVIYIRCDEPQYNGAEKISGFISQGYILYQAPSEGIED